MARSSDPRRHLELAPGVVLGGKYQVVEELGAGGMGRVFAARHLLLERRVAIKVLAALASEQEGLLREARAAQSLQSENVISIYDVAIEDDTTYIVMELLDGKNLSALVAERGSLAHEDAVDLAIQACAGLAEAHAAGVVHRDVKPSNLFLTRRASGEPLLKVLDFGISRSGEMAPEPAGARKRELLGSPHYMSPEQFRNPEMVDARTDVWSLGVTLYTLIAGARPFEGETLREIAARVATDTPARLSALNSALPPELDAVIAAALAKRPEERLPSVLAFAEALSPFASSAGRLNAERMARAFRALASSPLRGPGVAPRSEGFDLTVTDERFANTRSVRTEAPPIARPRRKRTVWLVASGLLAVGSFLALRHAGPSQAPTSLEIPLAAAALSAASSRPTQPQPEPSSAAQHAPHAATAIAPSRPALSVDRSLTRAARTSKPALRSGRSRPQIPLPPSSAAPARSTLPVDIDGIPILE